ISRNNNRRNGKAVSRFRLGRNNGQITEDERLLHRPAQPLISPIEPVPPERVKDDEHALERAMQIDFTNTDPWRVFRTMSEFVEGLDTLSHIPPARAVFGSA